MIKNNNILSDLRIVNTCSNNCLYCLEQSYRKKQKFIDKQYIFDLLSKSNTWTNINFYWWNPLLHPYLIEIIKFSRTKFENIWLLTNTFWLNKNFLDELINSWLNSIWVYFNSFSKHKHKLINWNWISLKELLDNIKLLKNNPIFYKIIIHINNQNIDELYRDILILNTKFWVKNIEFINYFPFDRPYQNKKILEYSFSKNRQNIDNIFKIIEKFNIKVKFIKFDKKFFWKYFKYYDFDNWIVSQIWEEDFKRLSWKKTPFCYTEQRCDNCFIKDNCRFYVLWS